MRLALFLAILLPLPLAAQTTTRSIVIGKNAVAINLNELPADQAKVIQTQLEARNQALRNSEGNRSGGGNNPEQQRLKLLQQLTIDRSPSGILQARVEASRPPEPEPEVNPQDPASADTKQPELNEAQLAALKKREELQAKIKELKESVNAFRIDVTLGNWDEVRAYLEALPDATAKATFTRVLSQLGGKANVKPRPELAALGARPHQQNQYLRPSEILALSDASKTAPDRDMLRQLAALLPSDNPPPANFFARLKAGTRYLGPQDLESRLRSSELLLNADLLEEASEYLPEATTAREANNTTALNLLARYHADAHKQSKGKNHLPTAWALSMEVMSTKDAPLHERGEALYRALSLVPELEDGTGANWLKDTFTHPQGEGFEILAAVGTLAAQSRQVKSDYFRLEQLKLQAAATKALLAADNTDLAAWAETLTLYALNWIYEADQSYRLDQSTSIRPQMRADNFGNIYYAQERVAYQGQGPNPIPAADLVKCMPEDQWLDLIDEPVRLDCLTRTARLFLKVKEEVRAFPVLRRLAAKRPKEATGLVSEMISVWAQNHNPNQASRYRSSYYYFYGANRRAETIPLTRSKQERNLKELADLVTQVRNLELEDSFEEEFSEAFIQAHSQAEVWRVEALEAVFGNLDDLNPETIAALLRRMRTNLATLWPNPKIQQQAKTKRTDKQLEAHILKGYSAARKIAASALHRHPEDWRMQVQLASLTYEESNYKSTINPTAKHSTTKRKSLDGLAAAAATYTASLPLDDQNKESTEVFETWFYGALGSPDLGALKAHHQPVPSETAKIKAALEALPEECAARHLDRFATTINNRLANVSPDLKFRYLDTALQIIGHHERVRSASDVFQYYKDLITEIELDATIDGSDQISPDTPFGLFVNLRHTQEIERESGGFQRYLQNQNNNQFGYNFGRNTEDYRDKFEQSARAALEEHFEVNEITFHNDKITSRSDPEFGWRITPYAYLLLTPKGPEVDAIPPLKMDLDFLDTSGYVVLPVSSSAIQVDASGPATPRPIRDLTVHLTLDERNAEDEQALHLDVKASGLGLVPPLNNLLDTKLDGFTISDIEDRQLLVEELDAESEDGAPRSVREWRLTLTATGDTAPSTFTFPTVLVPVKEDDGLVLQRYEDVDLVTVPATVQLGTRVGPLLPPWIIITSVLVLAIIVLIIVTLRRRTKPIEQADSRPPIPSTLTPVTLLSFLDRLQDRLPEDQQAELTTEIQALQDRFFGPTNDAPTPDLHSLAIHWQKAAS